MCIQSVSICTKRYQAPYRSKKVFKNIYISVTATIILLLLASKMSLVNADRLESNSYVIQFGNFNVTSGEKSSSSYTVTDTVGQTGAGPFGEYGSSTYFVGSGFQYIYQIDDFSFELSKQDIDLGTLLIGSHSSDAHTMTVTTRGAGGYTVYAYETQPLTHSNDSDTIPNTTCDAADCSYTTSSIWNNQSVPGFGYNMSGDDVPAAFIDSTYFKAFADDSLSQPQQAVMGSTNIANARTATTTYKAGIDSSQAAGEYDTTIIFTAVPGF